jgi:hypothetical protein
MKLPKYITICGQQFHLALDPTTSSGSFDEASRTIKVGTKYPHDVHDTLLHEIVEGVFAMRMMRYAKEVPSPDSNDMLFCFGHEAFQLAIGDIVAALKGIKF